VTQEENPLLIFRCPSCGLRLSIHRSQGAVSGPCPACGNIIQAPQTAPRTADLPSASIPSTRSLAQGSEARTERSKRRIPVDSIIDHGHLEHRESMKSILVIALFVLAICACIAATLILKYWMGR
jgi:hypothetical protein